MNRPSTNDAPRIGRLLQQLRELEHNDKGFTPSDSFEGPVFGKIFNRNGSRGSGYYTVSSEYRKLTRKLQKVREQEFLWKRQPYVKHSNSEWIKSSTEEDQATVSLTECLEHFLRKAKNGEKIETVEFVYRKHNRNFIQGRSRYTS